MANETSDTPDTPEAPGAAVPAKKKSNLVPILIVVGVIVLLIIGVGVWKLTSKDDSTTRSGPPPIKIANTLYKAWQAGDQTAAAKVATPTAVTAIFAIPAADGDGLTFGACTKTGAPPLPKACTFSRPGGELTMTLNRVNGKKVVTAVKLGPAATTPTEPTG